MNGTAQIQRFHPDLVVLDVMLPDVNGFQVCQQGERRMLRNLMLTARAEGRSRSGLALGATTISPNLSVLGINSSCECTPTAGL